MFANQQSFISFLPLLRWRLTITRTMRKPWMLWPRHLSASPNQKILHPPNKKRDWLTCSTKSPSSRSFFKLAGEDRKSHLDSSLFLDVSFLFVFERSLSLHWLPLVGCTQRMQARRCDCVRPCWTSRSWTRRSGLETRTASWWNTTASRATSKW